MSGVAKRVFVWAGDRLFDQNVLGVTLKIIISNRRVLTVGAAPQDQTLYG